MLRDQQLAVKFSSMNYWSNDNFLSLSNTRKEGDNCCDCPLAMLLHIASSFDEISWCKLTEFQVDTVTTPHHTHTYTHTIVLPLFRNLSGTTRVSRYQKGKTRKGKTNLDLLEQEIVSGSGICWAIYKSAPHPRQPLQHPTTQFFTGRMPFLPPNQHHQSIEGTSFHQ